MYQSIIIIGAARSGTNMLRDLLVRLPGVATWDCDEINYIWRHGNASHTHDEFGPELATPRVQRFVRKAFDREARRAGCQWLIEKTCANSLRVGFVDRIVPDAKYIFLTRDGRDVVASARKRWTAPLDVRYVAKKAWYVPKTDLPYYAARYFSNRIYRLVSGSKRLAFWGPQFAGIQSLLATQSLEQVCAAQWARSVARSIEAFNVMQPDRIHTIRYEHFVTAPREELKHLIEFLGVDLLGASLDDAVSGVKAQSIGNWRRELPTNVIADIEPILHDQLVACGYESISGVSRLERSAA